MLNRLTDKTPHYSSNPNKTKHANEQAEIFQPEQHGLDIELFSRNAVSVARKLQDSGYQAYLVGGCIRDALLGEQPKDFDVATSATPEQVRGLFRNSRVIGRRFRLAHVFHGREIVEVATFRSGHEGANTTSEQSSQDQTGRILRDNVYGTMAQDALRRDLTINALYYDVSTQCIHDFSGGVADIKHRVLRLIGEPEQRYLEDPVRMLRLARFAAKPGFRIDAPTAEPVCRLAPLLKNIPAARLYDECLKLFLSGSALAIFEQMRDFQLFAPLFPATAKAINQNTDFSLRLIENLMRNTDSRLEQGKAVTPAYLFAALLWPAIAPLAANLRAQGTHPVPALEEACRSVLHRQLQRISIPKRFSIPMREIWALQERLPNRNGRRAETLLSHTRFRAAYDFLLLRESAGEDIGDLGRWWTDFQELQPQQRANMLHELDKSSPRKRHRPRKKPANRNKHRDN